jgi:hypothetical protein
LSNSRAGFIACHPPALRRSFSVIGISLTGQQRRAFCAFAKIDACHTQQVALSSPQRSLGEDASAEAKEAEIKETQIQTPMEKMDAGPARGFSSHPGAAGGGSAIYPSSVDTADVD